MRPVLDLYLGLARLFHTASEHGPEVLTLSGEDSLVSKDLFTFHQKDNIRESWVVDDLSHVLDQTVDSLIIYFVFFKLTNIKDADVVEPLATVKTAEDKQLLSANHAGSVSLASCRSLL